MFQGFTQAAGDFYWQLLLNNERPWFNAHKEEFIRLIKDPLDDLARDTLAIMSERFPDMDYTLHVSRIYRDARRLFGRGPYKEHMWFSFWDGVEEERPVFWFEFGPTGFATGMGFWGDNAKRMAAYRRFIDAEPAFVERLAAQLAEDGRFRLEGEEYKRPKGDVGPVLNPWYNKRWLDIARRDDFGGELFSPDLPKILADGFTFLMPYYEFFSRFSQATE